MALVALQSPMQALASIASSCFMHDDIPTVSALVLFGLQLSQQYWTSTSLLAIQHH